jgi:hypothetical protein
MSWAMMQGGGIQPSWVGKTGAGAAARQWLRRLDRHRCNPPPLTRPRVHPKHVTCQYEESVRPGRRWCPLTALTDADSEAEVPSQLVPINRATRQLQRRAEAAGELLGHGRDARGDQELVFVVDLPALGCDCPAHCLACLLLPEVQGLPYAPGHVTNRHHSC